MRSSWANSPKRCILTCLIPRCVVTARQIPQIRQLAHSITWALLIVSTKDRPVRVKFTNNLPVGAGGNLFLPVDFTVDGSRYGSAGNECHSSILLPRTGPRSIFTGAILRGSVTGLPTSGSPLPVSIRHTRKVSVCTMSPICPTRVMVQSDLLLHQPAERTAHVLP